MVPPSCVGLAQHARLGNVDWRMAAGLAAGTAVGSFAGSKVAVDAPAGQVPFSCAMNAKNIRILRDTTCIRYCIRVTRSKKLAMLMLCMAAVTIHGCTYGAFPCVDRLGLDMFGLCNHAIASGYILHNVLQCVCRYS